MIYLYDWAGEPWKTQYWVREVMDRMYTPTPDGYCGDEDNGQTSAWYVFSALGFYPVAPGSGQYAIGSPLFKKVKVSLENGRVITLDAGDNSVSSPYIGSIMVNGKPHDANYFTYPMLLSGPYIRFQMQDIPSMLRGTGAKDVPYSYSD